MALMPARVKYRKMQRGSRTGLASRGNTVAFGEYGLQSLERCWMDTKQQGEFFELLSRFASEQAGLPLRFSS